MARSITIREALNESLDQEMERDPTVVLMGEDIAGGAGCSGEEEAWGGAMGIYKGLFSKRSEEHTSELQSLVNLVCRLLLEKKNVSTHMVVHNH